jgi:Ni2+-binding GTPase involved in maturation of urease and hydrogenase
MREVNPSLAVLEVSARTGAGMERWTDVIEERLAQKAGEPATSLS